MEQSEERRVDTCDVVVVGAGIVGAAIAARLAQVGRQVAVLEAQAVAGGATGRSAGIVVAGAPGHYRWAVQSFGRERAGELWRLSINGRDQLVETAVRLGVHLEQSGSLGLAVTDEEAEALRASAELLREDGFDAWFGATDRLSRGFRATLRQPDDAVVDAAALTQALLNSAPIAVHTDTEVYDLEPDGDAVRVWARGRSVRCAAVVLAVDGYAPLLDRSLGEWVSPGRVLTVTTDPLGGQLLPSPCIADYGYEYACPLPDGRLILGAWRRPRAQVDDLIGTDTPLRDGLARFIERYFPEAKGHIASRRSGVVGLTADGVPVIGRLPDLPQVSFAVGFGAWGLSWAFVAAERLVDWMVQGGEVGLLSVERVGGT